MHYYHGKCNIGYSMVEYLHLKFTFRLYADTIPPTRNEISVTEYSYFFNL